jgi:hypothetical protein
MHQPFLVAHRYLLSGELTWLEKESARQKNDEFPQADGSHKNNKCVFSRHWQFDACQAPEEGEVMSERYSFRL